MFLHILYMIIFLKYKTFTPETSETQTSHIENNEHLKFAVLM